MLKTISILYFRMSHIKLTENDTHCIKIKVLPINKTSFIIKTINLKLYLKILKINSTQKSIQTLLFELSSDVCFPTQ